MVASIPFEEIRRAVLVAFKRPHNIQVSNICDDVKRQLGLNNQNANGGALNQFSSGQSPEIKFRDIISEIIWDLTIERIVTVHNDGWPWVRLTDYGQKIVNEEKPTPHDPSGYLDSLKKAIPNIDDIIITYIEESLHTYNHNNLLSSAITLGCASEKLMLLLFAEYGEKESRFKEKIKDIYTIKKKYDEFIKEMPRLKPTLPIELKENIDTNMSGVFEVFRKYRNDAGHPTGKVFMRDEILQNLFMFRHYCIFVYKLMNFISQSNI